MRSLARIARQFSFPFVLVVPAIASCRGAQAPVVPQKSPAVSLPLYEASPLESVAKRGLSWFVLFQPKRLFSVPGFPSQFARVIHDEEFSAYASNHAGVDLRKLDQLLLASYSTSTLAIGTGAHAHGVFDAFSKRVSHVEHVSVGPYWYDQGRGTTHLERVGQFGNALYYEWGRAPHALRDAIHLAEERSHPVEEQLRRGETKTLASIRGEIPQSLLAVLEQSPACLYLRGPFEQTWASSFKGLLRTATGMALCATSSSDAIEVELFIAGDYSRDIPNAHRLLRESVLSLRNTGWMSRMFVLRGEPTATDLSGGLAMRITIDQRGFFETLAELTRDEVRDFAPPRVPGELAPSPQQQTPQQ